MSFEGFNLGKKGGGLSVKKKKKKKRRFHRRKGGYKVKRGGGGGIILEGGFWRGGGLSFTINLDGVGMGGGGISQETKNIAQKVLLKWKITAFLCRGEKRQLKKKMEKFQNGKGGEGKAWPAHGGVNPGGKRLPCQKKKTRGTQKGRGWGKKLSGGGKKP